MSDVRLANNYVVEMAPDAFMKQAEPALLQSGWCLPSVYPFLRDLTAREVFQRELAPDVLQGVHLSRQAEPNIRKLRKEVNKLQAQFSSELAGQPADWLMREKMARYVQLVRFQASPCFWNGESAEQFETPAFQWVLGVLPNIIAFSSLHSQAASFDVDVYLVGGAGGEVTVLFGVISGSHRKKKRASTISSLESAIFEVGGEAQVLHQGDLPATFSDMHRRGQLEGGVMPDRMPSLLWDLERAVHFRSQNWKMGGNARTGRFNIRTGARVKREAADVVFKHNGWLAQCELYPSPTRRLLQTIREL